jgi:hypothetical protein
MSDITERDIEAYVVEVVQELRSLVSYGITPERLLNAKKVRLMSQFAGIAEEAALVQAVQKEIKLTCTQMVGDFTVSGSNRQVRTVSGEVMGRALGALLGLTSHQRQPAPQRFEAAAKLLGVDYPYDTLRREGSVVDEWLRHLAEALLARYRADLDPSYDLIHGQVELHLNDKLQLAWLNETRTVRSLVDGEPAIGTASLGLMPEGEIEIVTAYGIERIMCSPSAGGLRTLFLLTHNLELGEVVSFGYSLDFHFDHDDPESGFIRTTEGADPRWRWIVRCQPDGPRPDYVWQVKAPSPNAFDLLFRHENVLKPQGAAGDYIATWSGLPARYWHGVRWCVGKPSVYQGNPFKVRDWQ